MNKMMENRVKSINEILDGMDVAFTVQYEQVPKNNVTRDALIMRPKGDGIMSPTVYMNGSLMEKTDEELAGFLTQMYAENYREAPDMTSLLSKNRILDTVMPRLFSAENSTRLDIRHQVYEKVMDLLITYYIPVQELDSPDGDAYATIQVTEEMLRQADITVEEVKKAAFSNLRATVDIVSMSDVLTQLMGAPMPGGDQLPMYVVTNKSRRFGAASILLDEVKDKLSELLGDGYYVLPSSIHEMLAVPAGAGRDAAEFLEMVTEINQAMVSLEDRLIDSVYVVHDREMAIA